MENFTPITAIIGDLLIGVIAVMLLGLLGRNTDISSIYFTVMDFSEIHHKAWRYWFLIGLIVGAGCYTWMALNPVLTTHCHY